MSIQPNPYNPYQPSQPGLGDEIYTGAASFGLIKTLIFAFIGTVVGVIMIILGIVMLFKKINTISVNGTILNLNCTPLQANNNQRCNIQVSYNYNGKQQNKYIQYTGTTIYSINQKVNIYVNTDNENEIYLEDPSPKTIGAVLIFFGLLIGIGGWVMYWLSKKYKFLAAAEGVSGAYNLIR
jgi:hypothetical protein